MEYTFISQSAEDTNFCGRALARAISPENRDDDFVLLLSGDLGAGKTTFINGLVNGFGGPEGISSPSFNILNIYPALHYTIYHIDAYRDANISWESLMLDDIVRSPFCCAIEWPENFHNLPKLPTIFLKFSASGGSRSLTFSIENEDWMRNFLKILAIETPN